MPHALRWLGMVAWLLPLKAVEGEMQPPPAEATIQSRPRFNIHHEGVFLQPPYTIAAVRLASHREDDVAAAEEFATWLLMRQYAQRWLKINDSADDPVWQELLNRAPLQFRFSGSRFEQQLEGGKLIYIIAGDDRTVGMVGAARLSSWCLQQNGAGMLEAAIRLTAPLALPARKQALEQLRRGSLKPPEHCRHLIAVRELVAEQQFAVMQYGIAEAKLGNRVEAEQAKAVAQAWSSIPSGAFRTIAGSLGLGPSWQSGTFAGSSIPLHIQDMIGGSAASVLTETNDADADGWLYRAQAALDLRSPICALLAARRAIALGKHDAAALAAMACDQLGLPHSAQAYRAWPGLFKDP